MILVFSLFGGERTLGVAREIADSLGTSAVAVSDGDGAEQANRLISLGADEVIKCDKVATVFDWSEILSSMLEKSGEAKFLLGISGPFTDAIFGRVYALGKKKVGAFATGIDSLYEAESKKRQRVWSASMRFVNNHENGKVNIFSFKSTSLPEPFEDESRYGKTSRFSVEYSKERNETASPVTLGLDRESYIDTSSSLVILAGRKYSAGEQRDLYGSALSKLKKDYAARLVDGKSKIHEVYGNCFAIDLEARREGDLPRFHGELLALNSSDQEATGKVADTVFVTKDISKVLNELS